MVNEAALVAAKQHAAHIDTAGLEFAQVSELACQCACARPEDVGRPPCSQVPTPCSAQLLFVL